MPRRGNQRHGENDALVFAVGALTAVGTIGYCIAKAYFDSQNETTHNVPAISYHTSYDARSRISEICSICNEDLTDFERKRLDCSHTFHTRCINAWTRAGANCPDCRILNR